MTTARRTRTRKRATRATAPRLAIGFLGGGNMATALIQGLLKARRYRPDAIGVSDVDRVKLTALRRRFGVVTTGDNATLARAARVIILAVKPPIIDAVLAEIHPAITRRHLVVSIAAGVPTARLEAGLGGAAARVVRVMPNTPALLALGMSVVVRGRGATAADERLTVKLMRAVGRAVAVRDEHLLDPVTGLSGSGPAYVYRFAEALIAGGVAAGLSPELARDLTYQTLTGAAAMLQETGEPPERLRAMVTSPGGTTFAGLAELDRRGFLEAVSAAVVAATTRSMELGRG